MAPKAVQRSASPIWGEAWHLTLELDLNEDGRSPAWFGDVLLGPGSAEMLDLGVAGA